MAWRGLKASARPLRRAGFWRGLAALSLVAALVYIGILAREQVWGRPEFRIKQLDIVGDIPPAGRDQLIEMLKKLGPSSTAFDPRLVSELGRRVQALSWVQRLESCERVFPDRLRLELVARRPVAVLVHRARRYLLDAQGRWLPDEVYAGTEGLDDLPAIVGVGRAPHTPGTLPEGADLKAALMVLSEIARADLWSGCQAQTVDVIQHERRGRHSASPVTIWTRGQTAIEWGNAPGEEETHEPRVPEKLARLRALLEQAPGLLPYARVRLQFDEVTWIVRTTTE